MAGEGSYVPPADVYQGPSRQVDQATSGQYIPPSGVYQGPTRSPEVEAAANAQASAIASAPASGSLAQLAGTMPTSSGTTANPVSPVSVPAARDVPVAGSDSDYGLDGFTQSDNVPDNTSNKFDKSYASLLTQSTFIGPPDLSKGGIQNAPNFTQPLSAPLKVKYPGLDFGSPEGIDGTLSNSSPVYTIGPHNPDITVAGITYKTVDPSIYGNKPTSVAQYTADFMSLNKIEQPSIINLGFASIVNPLTGRGLDLKYSYAKGAAEKAYQDVFGVKNVFQSVGSEGLGTVLGSASTKLTQPGGGTPDITDWINTGTSVAMIGSGFVGNRLISSGIVKPTVDPIVSRLPAKELYPYNLIKPGTYDEALYRGWKQPERVPTTIIESTPIQVVTDSGEIIFGKHDVGAKLVPSIPKEPTSPSWENYLKETNTTVSNTIPEIKVSLGPGQDIPYSITHQSPFKGIEPKKLGLRALAASPSLTGMVSGSSVVDMASMNAELHTPAPIVSSASIPVKENINIRSFSDLNTNPVRVTPSASGPTSVSPVFTSLLGNTGKSGNKVDNTQTQKINNTNNVVITSNKDTTVIGKNTNTEVKVPNKTPEIKTNYTFGITDHSPNWSVQTHTTVPIPVTDHVPMPTNTIPTPIPIPISIPDPIYITIDHPTPDPIVIVKETPQPPRAPIRPPVPTIPMLPKGHGGSPGGGGSGWESRVWHKAQYIKHTAKTPGLDIHLPTFDLDSGSSPIVYGNTMTNRKEYVISKGKTVGTGVSENTGNTYRGHRTLTHSTGNII